MEGRGGTGLCPMAPSRNSSVESWDSSIVTKRVHDGSFHLKGLQHLKGKQYSHTSQELSFLVTSILTNKFLKCAQIHLKIRKKHSSHRTFNTIQNTHDYQLLNLLEGCNYHVVCW